MTRGRVFSFPWMLVYIATALLTWLAAQGLSVYESLERPYRSPRKIETLKIPPGAGAREIARILAEADVVPSESHFLWSAWLEGGATQLQAGEYNTRPAYSPRQWVRILRRGQRYRHTITIPEGLTTAQVAALFDEAELVQEAEFIRAANDPQLLERFDIQATSAQGYLFPETYQFERPVSATRAVETMIRHFLQETQSIQPVDYDTVVLASIIEREAQKPEDMNRVSTVFHNRLEKGWPLESDATIVYALREQNQPIEPLQRKIESPFNTYAHKGLPPAPICNPGLAALRAAKMPAPGDWMFFLSDVQGEFHFTRTHKEHVRLKRMFRKNQNRRD